jgi:hypothetical protein
MESPPFGRRAMCEGGGPSERGRGRWIGLNLSVSERDFQDFGGQLADARRFLGRHDAKLRSLLGTSGVRSALLDFGVSDEIDGGRGPAVIMSFRFPAGLVAMAAGLGVDLELSIYPIHRRMTKAGLR